MLLTAPAAQSHYECCSEVEYDGVKILFIPINDLNIKEFLYIIIL